MPSKSKSQQRLFGIIHSCQKNEKKKICSEPSIKKIIQNISKKDAKDFASTKHEDLPERLESFKNWLESQKGEKMEENKCMCDCPPCKSGDCSSCTCKNCKCENCTCN